MSDIDLFDERDMAKVYHKAIHEMASFWMSGYTGSRLSTARTKEDLVQSFVMPAMGEVLYEKKKESE